MIDLKSCGSLHFGKILHAKAEETQNDSPAHAATALIRMYAKCGSISEARGVFDNIENPNVASWTAMLLGYAETGDGITALKLFLTMKERGCTFDSFVYVATIKACACLALSGEKTRCLERGREIHSEAASCLNHYVQAALINMYARCGSMEEAHNVFDGMHRPDVVSWNALILGYAENGEGLSALELFSTMKAAGYVPVSVTYVAALKACACLGEGGDDIQKREYLEQGRELHCEIGPHLVNQYVQGALIDMYSKCGCMVYAEEVFRNMKSPDVVAWTTLLMGYVENGDGSSALNVFSRMKDSGCTPNALTYNACLKACILLATNGDESRRKDCLERGKQLHLEIGCCLDIYLQQTLMELYAASGSMSEARDVFDSMDCPDTMSWNVLLLGYTENGEGVTALNMFSAMKETGRSPNTFTYVAVLRACTSLIEVNGKEDCLKRGREIHKETGCSLDHYLQGALVDMYSKCGSMGEAHCVFNNIRNPDVVSWTSLILGYAENGEGYSALELFSRMKAEGCIPDSITYVAALKASVSLANNGDIRCKEECLERGREIHSEIGSQLNFYVENTLIDMYGKCGCMAEARQVFDNVQRPKVVAWTALLSGYAENGEGHVTLDLFARMKKQGCAPNSVTYIAVLKACGIVGALALGREYHSEIKEYTPRLLSYLVDFYAKCGSMCEAREAFDRHPKARNVTTWNVLLSGYGKFGDSDTVFSLFDLMQDEGFVPDAVTFVSLLLSCSHSGLVGKAWEYFEKMQLQCKFVPSLMHYTCMVDVLGRGNQLNEAISLLQKIPHKCDVVTWMALLGACRKWYNVEIGRMAFQSLVSLDDKFVSGHVLMAHIYGWDEFEKMLVELPSRAAPSSMCIHL